MLLAIVRANYEARSARMGELRAIDEAAADRAYTEDETAKVAELRSGLEAIDARIQEGLKQEIRSEEIDGGLAHLLGVIADRENGELTEAPDTRSVGQRFTGDDGYAAWAKSPRGSYAVEMEGLSVRAVTDVTLGATSGGALTRPDRLSRVGQDFLDRRTYLLDLLPHIPVNNGTVEYVQDKTPLADLANKAVEVSEAGTKPQAGVTLQVVQEPIATIAAWVNITRQAAADVAQIEGYLDTRLRYSLKRRSDIQAVNGDGALPNLRGLINRTGILTYAPGGAEARYRSIRRGIRLMEDAETVPEIIVLNPADAEIFDLSNDTSAGLHAGDADGGGLRNAPARTAWGLTQVRSTAVASGTALLIDPMAVAVFDRMAPTAYMTDSHASNFTSNLLTLLLELRLGLGLFEPSGVLKITFNGTT